jgi:VWFA-related protein
MRTHPSLRCLIVLALAAPGLIGAQDKPPAPQTPPAQEKPADVPAETPTFPAQVEQVIVDLVVTDKQGNPIGDIKKEELAVTEDGAPQQIVSFEAIQVPDKPSEATPPKPVVSTNTTPEVRTGRSFLIVWDDVHLTPFQARRAKEAVASFLKTGVREGDRVSLIATGGGAWWSTRMEAGRDELIAMLKRLDGRYIPDTSPERMTEWEAMKIHVYRDQQVADRVNRRYDTYGVNQQGRQNQGTGAGNRSFADVDPQVAGRAAEVYYSAVTKNRLTLETLERVLDSLRNAKGRKSMILVSEGFIYDPNLDEFKRVVQASRRSNVAVYFLDTRGLVGMPVYMTAEFGPALDNQDIGAAFAENLEAAEGSEEIASDSGGFTVRNSNDLAKGIQRIANEASRYYLVGYIPTNTARDGKFRKINVKIERKGVQVRARKGYYAPLEGAKPKERKPGTPDPVLQAALDSPYEEDDVPLRMTSYVFDETLLGKAKVLIAADVDVRGLAFEEKDGRFMDSVEFMLIVAHRDSGEFWRYDQQVDLKLQAPTKDKLGKTWMPLVRDFELPPGGFQAKLVVRDKNAKKVGTVIHEFEVQDLASFRTSTPILSDTLQKPAENAPANTRPTPALLARRDFAAGETLYCSIEVYGAEKDKKTGMPKVAMGYELHRADGTTVAHLNPTVINPTSLGKLSRLMGIPIDQADPGIYELVLKLEDQLTGKTLERKEPFAIKGGSGD